MIKALPTGIKDCPSALMILRMLSSLELRHKEFRTKTQTKIRVFKIVKHSQRNRYVVCPYHTRS